MSSRKVLATAVCFLSFVANECVLAQANRSAYGTAPHDEKTTFLEGVWLGELRPPDLLLHLRLNVTVDAGGQASFTMYSLDQGAQPVQCTNVKLTGKTLLFEVPAVKGRWEGKVSPNRKTLVGTWTQGNSKPLPLNFVRQGNLGSR